MADRPQEYINPNGKVTTNSIEGFHSMALKYCSKRLDLKCAHYCCKTNMAICYKNLGPLWKLIMLSEMGCVVKFLLRQMQLQFLSLNTLLSLIHSSKTIMKVVEKLWYDITDALWSTMFGHVLEESLD